MDSSRIQSCSAPAGKSTLGRYILAAVGGALIVYLLGGIFSPAPTLALPQEGTLGSQAVMAVPAQLASDVYGLYLIDLENQTILLYSYGGPWAEGLRLLSARSFKYDRKLLDFNAGKPSPQDVRQLLEAALKTSSSPVDTGPVEPNSVPEP